MGVSVVFLCLFFFVITGYPVFLLIGMILGMLYLVDALSQEALSAPKKCPPHRWLKKEDNSMSCEYCKAKPAQ